MIHFEELGPTLVLEVAGPTLDAHTSKEFRREIENKLKDRKQVVIDMSQLSFMDSSGLGVLLSCLRQVGAAGGQLKLVGLTAHVRAVFQLVRMHRVFDIHNSREEALRSFA